MKLLYLGVTVVLAVSLAGCADRIVTLRYTPPPAIPATGPELVIMPIVDNRGKEGDQGDVRRVGGLYGGYGNRWAKVMMTEPWPPRLIQALVAEFRGAGIYARSAEGIPPDQLLTLPRLETEVRNFSTEARWGREAHIGAIIRLRDGKGRGLVEKKIEARDSGYNRKPDEIDLFEVMLNAAFAQFVASVTGDREIRAALATLPQAGNVAARRADSTLDPPAQSAPRSGPAPAPTQFTPSSITTPTAPVRPFGTPLPPAQLIAPSSAVLPPAQSSPPSSAASMTSSSDPALSFEAQLDALADLKTRGRITEEEYQVMRRRLVEGAKPESLARAEASPSLSPLRPQPVPLKWFLGSWQGRLWREGGRDSVATLLYLKQDGPELRWEMFTLRREYLATGTATLSGERLELHGLYIAGRTSNRAISLTLTKTGEALEGTVRGMESLPFLASYRRPEP